MALNPDLYEEWGEPEAGRGGHGGGKKKDKGPTKSSETASKEQLARLKLERQKHSEVQIQSYIAETWKSFDEPDKTRRIGNYAKWMEKASREKHLTLNLDEVRIKDKRSSGAGGQNVQKNSTAINVTHIPTRISASSQDERSQLQNKESSLAELRLRLNSHLDLWKETSHEFRKSLMPQLPPLP
jgi:hypothetical protein